MPFWLSSASQPSQSKAFSIRRIPIPLLKLNSPTAADSPTPTAADSPTPTAADSTDNRIEHLLKTMMERIIETMMKIKKKERSLRTMMRGMSKMKKNELFSPYVQYF